MWKLIKLALSVCTGGLSSALTAVVPWLLKHWRGVIIVVAVAAAGIAGRVLVHERDMARSDASTAQRSATLLQSQVDALSAAQSVLEVRISQQSASILAEKSAASDAQRRADVAMRAADSLSRKDRATIKSLRARSIQNDNMGSCDAELARIRAGL